MRVFQCSGAYARHIAEAIKRAVEEARLDEQLRADDDERVRRLALVPDEHIVATERGTALVLVGVVDDGAEEINDLLAALALSVVEDVNATQGKPRLALARGAKR